MHRSRDEIDFGSSSRKLEKERERRASELRRRREKERESAAVAKREHAKLKEINEKRKAHEEAAAENARAAALEEERLTGGISFSAALRPLPTTRDGERILLPPSALATLTSSGALDASTPMAFQISAVQDGEVVGRTHAGVAEFIAEEGTVGVPPKTALSLTKGRGVAALGELTHLQVKYIKLPHANRAFVRLQPRGEGFHREGQEVVNMDIKAVLERELTSHTAITKGDWLPIRHERQGYELVVMELEPSGVGGALSLINTDLEVDLMPSEAVAREQERQRRIEEKKQRLEQLAEAKAAARKERAAALTESLPAEPPADQRSGVVSVLVRLPTGGQVSRRFMADAAMGQLFDFIDSNAAVALGVDRGEYTLGMNYPKRSFAPADAHLSLAEAGLTGRREALFLQTQVEEPKEEPMDAMDVETTSAAARPTSPTTGADQQKGDQKTTQTGAIWASATDAHVSMLDRKLSEEHRQAAAVPEDGGDMDQDGTHSGGSQPTSQELVGLFHQLMEDGVEKQAAAAAAQKFGKQLQELAAMGFVDLRQNLKFLERYGGRMLRVVNALSERPPAAGDTGTAAAPAPTPTPGPLPQAPEPQDAFQRKFAELVASGMPPNEAAAQAVLSLQGAPQPQPQPQQQQPEHQQPGQPGKVPGAWAAELEELAAMGFKDTAKNLELLERYQGRLVRVVNVLAGGD